MLIHRVIYVLVSLFFSTSLFAETLIFEFSGELPTGSKYHSQIAGGESWKVVFHVDGTADDQLPLDLEYNTFENAVATGMIRFSGGYSQTINVDSQYQISVANDLDVGVVIDAVAIVTLDSTFSVSALTTNNAALTESRLPESGTVYQSTAVDEFVIPQLSWTDALTGETIEYSTDEGSGVSFEARLLGDMNGDNAINLNDIDPLIDRIVSGEYDSVADFNLDNAVNVADIQPFVETLSNYLSRN